MHKVYLLAVAGVLCAAGLPLQATTVNYTLGTIANPDYVLNYVGGTGQFFVTGGFNADLSTATGSPLSVSTDGTAFVDFTDGGASDTPLAGGTYFGPVNLEFYTNNVSPSDVTVSGTDPLFATAYPVWTVDQQFTDLSANPGGSYYTLTLTGTTANLYQSATSSTLGTLIATGAETGAYPTDLPGYPTPEPGTFGLVGLAGFGAILLRRVF